MISHALHPNIFEQPVCIDFFNTLLEHFSKYYSRICKSSPKANGYRKKKNALEQFKVVMTERVISIILQQRPIPVRGES
jgi:hypothetical protein